MSAMVQERPLRHWTSITGAGLIAAVAAVATPVAALVAALGLIALVAVGAWVARTPGRWVTTFLVACLCLPPLPIALGNSGPHPALAIAALGIVAGALHWPKGYWIPRAALAFPVYVLALLSSIPFATWFSGPAVAAGSLARLGLFGISTYLFFYVLMQPADRQGNNQGNRSVMRVIYWAALASAAFAVIDFYFQFPAPAGFGAQFVWTSKGVFRRAQGMFYESSTLGNVCVFFLLFVPACLSMPRERWPVARPVLFCGSSVFLAALLLSFSRASVIALAVGLLTFLCVRGGIGGDRRRLARLAVLLAGLAGLALTGLYIAMPDFLHFYGARTLSSLELMFTFNERVLSGRAETWRVLTSYVMDHPQFAIFGVGYKTLPYSDFIGQITVADNSYLSALVETGLVGFTALLLLHGAILRMAWMARTSLYGIWILSFWVAEIVQMLSGDLLTYWRVLPLYFWVLALAVREGRQQEL